MDDGPLYTAVGHRGMSLCNPLSTVQLDEVIAVVNPAPGDARAIDVGCGKGELLIRLAEHSSCRGTGIESNPLLAAEAREAVAARCPDLVDIIEADASARPLGQSICEVAAAVGASHALGGTAPTLAALAAAVCPGGFCVLGDGYWRRPPGDDDLQALEVARGEIGSLAQLVATVEAAGLLPVHVAVASEQDWDRYEWAHLRNLEFYAATHPGDPQAARLWERRLAWRDTYLAVGRDLLGFALVVARRPLTAG